RPAGEGRGRERIGARVSPARLRPRSSARGATCAPSGLYEEIPEEDEHLVLRRDAALDRAGVADAVLGAGRAVAERVVAAAELGLLGPVQARDGVVLARSAQELEHEGRIGRGRLALHGGARRRAAVVVERAVEIGPLGGVRAV